MNLPITVTQNDLLEILINIAPVRPLSGAHRESENQLS